SKNLSAPCRAMTARPVSTDPAAHARIVRDSARGLGFHAVGIARSAQLPEGDVFRAWLMDGRHADMAYMERRVEERLDPVQLDPSFRSIVSVAMSYWHDDDPPNLNPPPSAPAVSRGRIARYARGADYHNVLGKRLRKLLAELRRTIPGLDGKAWVDTGPIMDRAWASRSGIGWWGKHTNLVSRKEGSWLLLGTMALNIELDPDPPHDDFCGSCRRCIDACPTNATMIGDWIFGCDLCLDVCPWNRFAERSREARFAAREDRVAPALEPLLGLSDEAFRLKFNGSPIQRAGRDGFVRNVCVALGNVGGPENLESLRRTANLDPSDVVREHARWGIQRLIQRHPTGV
ncbi:MAG: putative 4Fe-4S ferredoxin, iron-sulfur binding, partial [bacterium]